MQNNSYIKSMCMFVYCVCIHTKNFFLKRLTFLFLVPFGIRPRGQREPFSTKLILLSKQDSHMTESVVYVFTSYITPSTMLGT